MAQQQRYFAASPRGREWMNLAEVEELVRQAREAGFPDDADFRVEWRAELMAVRYAIVEGA